MRDILDFQTLSFMGVSARLRNESSIVHIVVE